MDGENTPGTQAPNDDTQQNKPGAGDGAQGGTGDPQGTGEPQGAGDGAQGGDEAGADYRKKYAEAISHAREWEKRAKANKDAAAELQQLKDAQKTEAEKQADRLSELEAENAEFKAREDRAQWAAEVAETTGVPAEVLRGSTREEIEAHAETLKPHFAPDEGAGDGQGSSADKSTAQAFGQSPQGPPQSLRQQIDAAIKAGDYDLASNLKASMLGASN